MTFRELCSKEVVQLKDGTLTIPWADIERVGLDAILVRTDIPAPPPSHGGLLDKLHQWLNG